MNSLDKEFSIKEIWKVELKILENFDSVCKKHNLRYFADSGTLLGAIRHDGFIPWDDDIDVVMLRKDYNKFLKIAKKEFQFPYYVQTGYNEKGYFGGLIHVRDSNTTAILKKNFPTTKYNQGIFIDVFPLDNVIENKFLLKIQALCKKILFATLYTKQCLMRKQKIHINKVALVPLALLPQKFLYFIYDKICSLGNLFECEYVDTVAYYGTCGKRKKTIYHEVINHKFEDTTIAIPKDYHESLLNMYGSDYMIPKKFPSDHGEVFFDTEISYKEYITDKQNTLKDFFK